MTKHEKNIAIARLNWYEVIGGRGYFHLIDENHTILASCMRESDCWKYIPDYVAEFEKKAGY